MEGARSKLSIRRLCYEAQDAAVDFPHPALDYDRSCHHLCDFVPGGQLQRRPRPCRTLVRNQVPRRGPAEGVIDSPPKRRGEKTRLRAPASKLR